MDAIFIELLKLLAFDLLFVGILLVLLVPLAAYMKAAYAVLKRNFIGYFSNPTGYVFLCVFVLMTSTAAFFPHAFFVANLANLDQLNYWLPSIMLVFVPAITMSIWAEEKRQGTDELLLTLPAGDFDIVIGKYLAAASVFTVSLLLSQLANYTMLVWLTLDPDTNLVDLDTGLFFATYFGYWLIGLAMLSVGMVASFLTNNLTVSFILGMAFNSVLVGTQFADMVIPSASLAQRISRWSYASQFDDFGRGVISLSSTAFFALIIALGIYVSMVLIGKRHWSGGRDGQSMWWHYLARTLALVVVLVGVNLLLERWDFIRQDVTHGQVSSLSPDSRRLLASLAANDNRPIRVHAYISANLPDEYVKTRYNLVSMLKELERQPGSRVRVDLHDNLEPFSPQASQAEERFGISRQVVRTESRGAFKEEEFILGAAFACGRENVVVPFFGNGVPVEYELVRSIATVGRGERKRLGVVNTDAQLSGGFSFVGMQPRQIPKQLILQELEKQYKVEEVDVTSPIELGKFDALLVVQPSSLGPPQLHNVVEAVKAGQPAAIFEDPFPYVMGQCVGTAEPKPPMGGGMMGMGGQPQPKGDIRALWKALGIQVIGEGAADIPGDVPATIVWQDFNPYPKFQIRGIGPELVFIRNDAPGAINAFNSKEPVCAGFEELLLPYPTGITQALGSKLSFTELIATSGTLSGTIKVSDWQGAGNDPYQLEEKRGRPAKGKFTLAAWIRDEAAAKAAADATTKDAAKKDEKAAAAAKPKGINVIYVGDIDLMHSEFVQLRNQPNAEINFRFDNVPFVLNVIDAVAGDDRFLEIRTRKPRHSTLKTVEARAAKAREAEDVAIRNASVKYEDLKKKVEGTQKELDDKYEEIQKKAQTRLQSGEQVDQAEILAELQRYITKREAGRRTTEVELERLRRDRDKELSAVERQRDQDIQKIQNEFKLWATVIPPIPPLLVGLVVFIRRRLREREGVSRTRMK